MLWNALEPIAVLVAILKGAFPPPHCTELLLVLRLLYIILDGQYPMFVSSVNNDHTRILESKIIKIEILPPEFLFWSAKCRVWQAFTKYPSVVYLDKLLRNSKTISLFKMTWWGFRLQEHLWPSIVLPWKDKLCLKVKSMANTLKWSSQESLRFSSMFWKLIVECMNVRSLYPSF